MAAERNQEFSGSEFGQNPEESTTPRSTTPPSRQLTEHYPSALGETYSLGLRRGVMEPGREIVFGDVSLIKRIKQGENTHSSIGINNKRWQRRRRVLLNERRLRK